MVILVGFCMVLDAGWKCSYYPGIIGDIIDTNTFFVDLNNLFPCESWRYVIVQLYP
jgi:hypothetical protein